MEEIAQGSDYKLLDIIRITRRETQSIETQGNDLQVEMLMTLI